jgi:hypothetical protein
MAAAMVHQRHHRLNLFPQDGGMQTAAGAYLPSLPTFWLTLPYPNATPTPHLLHRLSTKLRMLELRYLVHLVLQQLRLLVSAQQHS